ncbi:MAG: DUF805 domain-containing protein [Actinobacteria bacterium]|nr:DUF805 domain-containing protein [Actinomycetota bacterium]
MTSQTPPPPPAATGADSAQQAYAQQRAEYLRQKQAYDQQQAAYLHQQQAYAQQGAAPQPGYPQPQPLLQHGLQSTVTLLPKPTAGGLYNGAAGATDLSRPLYGARFADAIKRFLRNYVNFAGRASRSEFWWTMLFNAAIMLIPAIFTAIGGMIAGAGILGSFAGLGGSSDQGDLMRGLGMAGSAAGAGAVFAMIGFVLFIICALGIVLPTLTLTVRRLHDANLPGAFGVLGLLALMGLFNSFGLWLGLFVYLAVLSLPSKPEGRRYDV